MENSLHRHVQSFGSKLSAMIMPNIGAFIAWGLITAIFIPAGWLPNEELAKLVAPMLRYLLPLLIAYTSGSNVAGTRGGIMGTVATIGVIEGSDVPMFLGARVMGPLAGLLIKWFDTFSRDRVKPGFEMLVNNFSIGILGMVCAIIGFLIIGPIMLGLTSLLNAGVAFVLDKGVLPLVAIFIEPAKVLFLNNAINHGILTPLGIEQARELGSSLLFLLEANPGPGLGILLAYMLRGEAIARKTAPASAVILLFGGIHEIYFPYVLMRPALIVAAIAGSASAMAYYQVTGFGLVSAASPGSIVTIAAMSPRGMTLQVLLGIVIAAAVSFLVAFFLVKGKGVQSLEKAQDEIKKLKNQRTQQGSIQKIVFACQAGMGSSAMGATNFRGRIKQKGITVINSSIENIPPDADIVVCQSIFFDRVSRKNPKAEIIIIKQFLDDPALDELERRLTPPSKEILTPAMILLGASAGTREEAIGQAGKLLVEGGYVEEVYVEKMQEREKIISTYIGLGIAVPHGTSGSHEHIMHSGISIIQYPGGVDFDGEKAYLVIGIAGTDGKHMDILTSLSTILSDEEILEEVKKTEDKMYIYNLLSKI